MNAKQFAACASILVFPACTTISPSPLSLQNVSAEYCARQASNPNVIGVLTGPSPRTDYNTDSVSDVAEARDAFNRDAAAVVIATNCNSSGFPILPPEVVFNHSLQTHRSAQIFLRNLDASQRNGDVRQCASAEAMGGVSPEQARYCTRFGFSPGG